MSDRVFVVDTSLFVNPQSRKNLGKTPDQAVKSFIKHIKKLGLKVYVPPSIFNEMKNFISSNVASELETYIRIRSPSIYDIRLPAAVFYDFMEDIRERINKGLRLAEEFAKDNRPDNDEKLRKLREKYRDSMRTGILDSKEDLELILLAKELDATLISSDEGVIAFARQLGCGLLSAEKFHKTLKTFKNI